MGGIHVLRRDASRSMPVRIVTVRDLRSDKVAGIDAGADDYAIKPFYMLALVAHLRASVPLGARRRGPARKQGQVYVTLTLKSYSFDSI